MAILVGSRSMHNFIGGPRPKLGINENRLPKVGERQIYEMANYANLRRCYTQSCTIEKALIYIYIRCGVYVLIPKILKIFPI